MPPRQDRRDGCRAVANHRGGQPPNVEWLKEMWARQWRRAPNDDELRSIVADHVREEILSREARELRLDANDTVVRRRLAQKMAFLPRRYDKHRRTAGNRVAPSLRYESGAGRRALARLVHPGLLQAGGRRPGRRRGSRCSRGSVRCSRGSGSLRRPPPPGRHFRRRGRTIIDESLRRFVRSGGSSLPADRWSGPIESSYGLHLVKVTGFQEAQPRSFAEVRGQLAEEWYRRKRDTRTRGCTRT